MTSLWALVCSCRTGAGAAATAAVAAEAAAALAAADGPLHALHIAESGGVLHTNGAPLPLDVTVFGAAQGLASLLRDLELDYVCFDAGVDAGELLAWAQRCALAQETGRPPDRPSPVPVGPSVHETARRPAGEVPCAVRRREPNAADTDSRLRSVFLQFHLMHAFGQRGPVQPALAKVVVQAVVDRLLTVPGGIEPLVLLQRDPQRMRRATEVAVLAVVFARVAGWPDDRLADLGGAALLHDLGALLDPARPGLAGFEWLMQRGTEDFWLRCALVARWWRDDQVVGGEQGLADAGTAALVRLAAAVADCLARGDDAGTTCARLRAGAGGPLAPALVDVAATSLLALR